MDYFFRISSDKLKGLFTIFFFYTLTHIFFLTLPPKGAHVWRQCHTSTVARNFVEESMNILKPRIDNRGMSDGVTGMPFPSFEYTVALISKVTGYHEGLNRLVAFLYFGLGIWVFYSLLFLLFKNYTSAFCGTWAFTFSPILYYHSITALPDLVALPASIAGLYYFLVWNDSKKHSLLLLSFIFTVLAGMTKIQYLAIGFPISVLVVLSFIKKKYSSLDLILLALYGIFVVSISIAWYAYALYMIKLSGLTDFGIDFRPAQTLSQALKILSKNIYSHFTEQLLSIPNLIPFFMAIYWVIKGNLRNKEILLMFSVWAFGLLAYHIIELYQMEVHLYYMFPYLPALFIVTTKGYELLLEKGKRLLVLLILISLPIIAFAGTFHNFFNNNKSLPTDFFNASQRSAIDRLIPDDALCIVGPDYSGAIYHYFTHTKGYTYKWTEEFTEQWLRNSIQGEAKYLIWDKRNTMPEFTKAYLADRLPYDGNDLEIYLLKK
jgi:hypothetical protein